MLNIGERRISNTLRERIQMLTQLDLDRNVVQAATAATSKRRSRSPLVSVAAEVGRLRGTSFLPGPVLAGS